jgi:ABC-type Fe2+-enterobactin transport system substrate-binding protein
MGEQSGSAIERILNRIEEHIEDWRRRDSALQAEADASRSRLWAEAAERERLLAEAVGAEEARRESIEELTKQNRVIFVLHREELAETLEEFARQGDKLVSVVPRRGGETISQGLKGSWLVFESPEDTPA